jgi:MGT family glycosyltransferase
MLAPNLMSVPGWGTPPLGPGLREARGPLGRARDATVGRVVSRVFDGGLEALNGARRDNGLAPVDHVLDMYARADRLLVLTSRAFDYGSFRPPANVRVTGPRLDDPAWAGNWTAPAGDAPLVLVAMSSTYMSHRDVMQRAASALGELPVSGLVTTGPAIAVEEIDAPPNVTVVGSAPHSQVLHRAAAVVTHGGHGTVMKTLAAGVPLVVVPLGRDQLDNAARVVHHGAGVRVRRKAGSRAIARAVRQILREPSYAAGAERLAKAIAEDLAEDRAVAELEALAAARCGDQEASASSMKARIVCASSAGWSRGMRV